MDEGERDLVAACARGEPQAFERLIARHDGALRAGCRRALRGRGGDQEEARAEVLRRLWQDAARVFGGFRFECPLEAWLRLVAYRTALSWAAGAGRRTAASAMPDPEAPPACDPLEVEESLVRLQRALEGLDPRDRAFLASVHVDGLPLREAARLHGIPGGSAAWRLDRLRERLGREIADSASRTGGTS